MLHGHGRGHGTRRRPTDNINLARVILGGIVAGLVINFSEFVLNQVVLLSDMTTALARMNLPPVGGSAIPVFIVLGFVGGIAAVWLYAAIRPRFGAGPKTALIAGLFFWFVRFLEPASSCTPCTCIRPA